MKSKVALPAAPRPVRTTYTLSAGESLASVALKMFGDARFAKLLHTVNRADIPTRSDGFSSFAFVYPGLAIVLPTYEESRIFAGHFFTPQSQSKFDLAHFARPAMPSDSIPMAILPSQGSRSPRGTNLDSQASMRDALPALPYLQADYRVNRNQTSTTGANQFECQYIVKHQTPTSEQQIFDMSPPTVKVPRLQDSKSIVEGPEVVAFSHYCRMIRFDAEGGQSDTIIKLQVLEDTRWQTITSYVITEQTSRRVAHYAEREQRAINIDLPCAVARELSISDLKRNWREYVRSYMTTQNKHPNFAAEPNMLQAC